MELKLVNIAKVQLGKFVLGINVNHNVMLGPITQGVRIKSCRCYDINAGAHYPYHFNWYEFLHNVPESMSRWCEENVWVEELDDWDDEEFWP